MDSTFDKIAVETIDLLEARLRRIEYAFIGYSEPSSDGEASVTQRLSTLEHLLYQLASKSKVVQDLLRLYSRYPDLFQSLNADDLPTTLDTTSILSMVMASASSYSATASRLTSVMDVPVPPAELTAQLIQLQPRISKIEAIQIAQNSEITQLRERSALIIQRWYTRDILRAGEDWSELEGKIADVEQKIRQASLAK